MTTLTSFDLGSVNASSTTVVPNFNRLQRIGVWSDEISNAEIVAKLESMRDLDSVTFQNSSEARQHLKKLMSR